jgi:16S rRNA (guanine527-N7)-methyltransferase
VPLAITEPGRSFTLIESRAKRVRFLRHVVGELPLRNVEVAHGRAEHLRPDRPFDTVLARAVAPPAELLAICRNLTAPGSLLLMLTATHLQSAFDGLAPDFVLRDAGRGSARGPKLRSTIVLLERTDAKT